MWGLLKQTAIEVWQRRKGAGYCVFNFGLFVFVMLAVGITVSIGEAAYLRQSIAFSFYAWMHVLLLGIFVSTVLYCFAPYAIKWHRFLAVHEPVSFSKSYIPSATELRYTFVFVLLLVALFVVTQIMNWIWVGFILPVIGNQVSSLFKGGVEFSSTVFAILVLVIYVVVFRAVYLRLPEIALGNALQGEHTRVSGKAKSNITWCLVLLLVLYGFLYAVFKSTMWSIDANSMAITTATLVIASLVGAILLLFSVTLLSVAAQRNKEEVTSLSQSKQ